MATDDNVTEDRRRLERMAMEALRNAPRVGSRDGFEVLAQARILPSFDDRVGYSLQRHQHGDQTAFVGTRRVWQWQADMQKFDSPVEWLRHPQPIAPTLITLQAPIPADVAMDLAGALDSLEVSAHPGTSPRGVDGTSFELEFGEGACRAEFRWWGPPPARWARLAERFVALVATIDRAIDDSSH